MTQVSLCGGGHARVLMDILLQGGAPADAVYDDDAALTGQMVSGTPVRGTLDDAEELDPSGIVLVNGLGNRPVRGGSGLTARAALHERFTAHGFRFASVVSPHAAISPAARLDDGVQVVTGAIINTGTTVGAGTIINTGAQLDHDCTVGTHCHVAPGAIVCGDVVIGSGTHVGAGAVITQGVSIGEQVMIAAGALVVKDVARGATVLGHPSEAGGTRSTVSVS